MITEVFQLVATKKTDNKVRWDFKRPEWPAKFSLYVPKWRVPMPVPAEITVTVSEAGSGRSLTRSEALGNQSLRAEPIGCVVERNRAKREPVHTLRFTPCTTPEDDWEIGEPYVPRCIVDPEASRLFIRVEWGAQS